MSSSLAGALGSAAASGGLQRRVGTVSSLNPLRVTVANGAVLAATGRLASYTPVLGHTVLVLVDDAGAAVVVGRLILP